MGEKCYIQSGTNNSFVVVVEFQKEVNSDIKTSTGNLMHEMKHRVLILQHSWYFDLNVNQCSVMCVTQDKRPGWSMRFPTLTLRWQRWTNTAPVPPEALHSGWVWAAFAAIFPSRVLQCIVFISHTFISHIVFISHTLATVKMRKKNLPLSTANCDVLIKVCL